MERSYGLHLEFRGGIAAEIPEGAAEELQRVKEWALEIPPAAMRLL